jgi:hypothetical protein
MISGPPNTTLFRTSAKPALGNVNFLQTSGADIITHDDVKYFRLQTFCLQTCWHYDEDLKKKGDARAAVSNATQALAALLA